VIALVIGLTCLPSGLREGPYDRESVAFEADLTWTEARTAAAMLAELETAFRIESTALAVVAWADLRVAP
jgi:hypothetical protein